jgi:hypothetical protein
LKSSPVTSTLQTEVSSGRPVDQQMSVRFEEMCDWLEAAEDQVYTLNELQEKLINISDCGDNVYSVKQLKRKLEEKYCVHIFFLKCVVERM